MRRIGPLDSKWLRRWTLRFGIAAFVTLALPALTVIALISIIGIPLGLAMMATPLLFVVVGLANIVQRLVGRDGPHAVIASLGLAVAALAGVAGYCNALLDRRGDELLSGDVDTLEKPLRADAIGLAGLDHVVWSKGQTRCDELCQRLLLSGAATRVLVPERRSDGHEWDAETPAVAFRLEERAECPVVQIPGRRSRRPVDDAKPDEAMRLAIASGRCLIEEAGTMADAEAVVVTGRAHRGAREAGAGLSLTADTVTVDRAAVHLRENGNFVERYRWTGLTVLRHPPIPIPTLVGGTELHMHPGFVRSKQRRNVREFAPEDGVDAIRFARDELGLDVAVPGAASSRASVIARGLDETGPLRPATRQVIEDLFESFVLTKQIDEPTRLLAFRALADPRVPAPRNTSALARACAGAGDAVHTELAAILFGKLMATDPALREDHPTYLGWPATYLANAIEALPPAAVLAHRRELEAIARDPSRRRRAHRALPQLAAFGSDAVPTMLYLVDEGLALKNADDSKNSRDREEWQTVFRSGLAGLCRLGPDASAALPPLLARLRDGVLPARESSHDLVFQTLARLGADPEDLQPHFARDASGSASASLHRDVERARSNASCMP